MLQRIKNYYHLLAALLALSYMRHPSRNLHIIGVTGTDGKTTTSSIIYHILKTAGKNVAMINTIGAYIGETRLDTGFHVTTPSSFAIQRYIKRAKEQGAVYVVLEVTSHALDQNRVYGVPFEVAVLTNITHEHLDYHKTYERYVKTKLKLLKAAKVSIINKDDESYSFAKDALSSRQIKTYSFADPKADLSTKTFSFKTPLVGKFNTMNCLAAALATQALGVDEQTIKQALVTFSPPEGRQEVIYDKDFRVIIDFAHTPNSFLQILPEIKSLTKGRLIHVFGAAGKRDASKRPLMGKAASQYDDVIILTAEDPRGEKVEAINTMITEGMKGFEKKEKEELEKKSYYEISDRANAIGFAIKHAKKGDTVLLTGKSHETSMNYGDGEEPWSERAAALQALEKRGV